MASHNDLGISGEKLAAGHLITKGYAILELNWKYGKAEVDIIAKTENLIVFIEVKTRTTNFFGEPEDAVTDKKQQHLKDAAEQYLNEKNLDLEVRFDIISIIINRQQSLINHITEAFY